jgi:hypothetical protein
VSVIFHDPLSLAGCTATWSTPLPEFRWVFHVQKSVNNRRASHFSDICALQRTCGDRGASLILVHANGTLSSRVIVLYHAPGLRDQLLRLLRGGKLHTSASVDSEVRPMEEWWAWLVQDHHISMAVTLGVFKSPILGRDTSPGANTRTGCVDKDCLRNFCMTGKTNTISA